MEEEAGSSGLLPDGWLAPRKEFFIEDKSGHFVPFAFDAELKQVASKAMSRGSSGIEFVSVARCRTCGAITHTNLDSMKLHAWKHMLPEIPWSAPVLPW